jgi:type I restriction enzyme, S subunit
MSENWPKVRLSEILTPVSRPVVADPITIYHLLGAHWYAKGLCTKDVVPGSEIQAKRVFKVEQGDFVYNRLFGWKGSFAVATKENDSCYVSNEFPCFAVNPDRADAKYLWKHFSRASVWEAVLDLSSGGTPTSRNRLKEEQLLSMEISLPPVNRQQQIVARIEELSAKIEEARTLRKQAAVEAEAVTGASASKRFREFPERLPVEAIAEVRGGIQKGPHRVAGANPVRYLTVAHVQRNRIRTDNPRYFEVSSEELNRWRLLSGDVLIIEGNGSAEQIGRTALFRGEIENCVHQNHIIRIRPDQRRVLPEFLNSFLNSPAGQDAVQGQSRTTSGLRTLSFGRIKAIPVPVPPLAEQSTTVAYLDDLQQKTDKLKAMQAETSAELDALMPSILDKAFRGEL